MSGGDCDVVVVGAGAAGIAAARRLGELGLVAVVLEARDRVGGRATTIHTAAGEPLDLGCEWLHSADRNPLTGMARSVGMTVSEKLPDWGRLRRVGRDPDAQRSWDEASHAFRARVEAAALAPEDRPAATLLEQGGRWNALLGAISTWANGVELERLSVKDYSSYDDSGVNWRVVEGYGSLIARLASGLDMRLGAAVTSVEYGGRNVVVRSRRGTVTGRAAVITLPTSLLAAETLRFDPALPAAKREAAAGVPLGLANKLFLGISGDAGDLPCDSHVLGATDSVATGSYLIRPHGRPLVAGYFGGAFAAELEHAGPAAMTDFAVAELSRVFGSAIRTRLVHVASSGWAQDPYARGSYSFALPGHSGDRAVLAAPVADRLFFAGEACSPHDFSTAHGAWLSGIAAAEDAAARLVSRPAG